jgi:hypothetical protein
MALRTAGEPFNDASQSEAGLGRFVCTEKHLLIVEKLTLIPNPEMWSAVAVDVGRSAPEILITMKCALNHGGGYPKS